MDWDDLKFLLAVADGGGLAAAARNLRVDPSTVSRRITALEKALGTELAARTPEGMTLTAAGQQAVETARRIERELAMLEDTVAGDREEPAGSVKVTATDSFTPNVLRAFAPLRERYPRLAIDIVPTAAAADLRRREADLAVRMFRDEHDGLAMRKLGTFGWSLYATAEYLAGRPSGPRLLDGHQVIGYSDTVKGMSGAQWLAEHAPPEAIRLRCGGPRAALDAALAHAGVCVVPCYVAIGQPIVRMTEQVLATSDVYAVFLPERRGEARLRVVIDALLDMFDRERASLTG